MVGKAGFKARADRVHVRLQHKTLHRNGEHREQEGQLAPKARFSGAGCGVCMHGVPILAGV